MWLRYTAGPIEFDPRLLSTTQPEPEEGGFYQKPRGLWITDDSDWCWRSWCESEGFRLDALACKHEVMLDESRILFIRTALELLLFTKDYKTDNRYPCAIDWPRVASEHSGIIITPYQNSVRLSDRCSWYYTWDCASGCIWDPRAIHSIRLLETIKQKESV